MSKLKTLLKILSAALTFVLALMLVSNIYTICVRTFTDNQHPRFLGFSSAVIVSGSMEDTIEINDLAVCLKMKDYDAGDIITYIDAGDSLTTHRIVSETDAGFITQGDANNTPDRLPVMEDRIMGKVIVTIPKIGLFIEFLRTPLGLMCILFAGLIILALPSAFDHFDQKRALKESDPSENGGHDHESTDNPGEGA